MINLTSSVSHCSVLGLSQKKKTLGFLVEDEITLHCDRSRDCYEWNQNNFELCFEDSSTLQMDECPIHISKGNYGAFRYNPKVERISEVYSIESLKKLNSSVTIKIRHDAPSTDLKDLCFIFSSDDQPPFNFEILEGGHFTDGFGEIKITHFSKYAIGVLNKYGFKGLLALFEKSYVALLHCSLENKHIASGYSWHLYVSVVKNCSIFKQSLKEDISSEFEDVELIAQCKVVFENQKSEILIDPECKPTSGWCLDHLSHPSIEKDNIDQYFDISPPLVRYKLSMKQQLSGSSLKIQFILKNLKKPKNVLTLIKEYPACKLVNNFK